MRTTTLIATATLTALVLGGCTAEATSTDPQVDARAGADMTGRPSIAHITAPTGPDTPVSAGDANVSAYDPDEPADAAAALIIDALTDEGLLVTSIDTEELTRNDRRARVRVEAAHSPGHGHPIQSSYLLELQLDPDGWQIVAFTEPA